jgi:hypothetical protein
VNILLRGVISHLPKLEDYPLSAISIDYSPSDNYPPQAYPDIASSISDLMTSSSGDETDMTSSLWEHFMHLVAEANISGCWNSGERSKRIRG